MAKISTPEKKSRIGRQGESSKISDTRSDEYGEVFFSWDFPEFGTAWRNKKWYKWAILVAIALLLYSLIVANYLFAVIVMLVGIIYFFQSFDSPLTIRCEISEDGIRVGKTFYDYRDLTRFWIIYEPPEIKTLYIEFKNPLKPRLGIALQNQNPLEIRDTLRQYLEEESGRDNEPISDGLSRLFRLHH